MEGARRGQEKLPIGITPPMAATSLVATLSSVARSAWQPWPPARVEKGSELQSPHFHRPVLGAIAFRPKIPELY